MGRPKHGNWNIMPNAEKWDGDRLRESHPKRPDHLERIFLTARKMLEALNAADLAGTDRALVIQIVSAAYKRIEGE